MGFTETENVGVSYTKLVEIIKRMKDKHVPVSTYRESPNPPWTNKAQVKRAIRSKWMAFKRFKRTRDQTDQETYISLRNKVKSLIRAEKIKYEKRIIEDTKNPKRLQSYCRGKTKNKKGIGNVMKKSGGETVTDMETAEELNEFFQSVFTVDSEQGSNHRQNPIEEPETSFSDIDFTEEDVLKVLSSLNPAKASGPDEMDAAILKNCAEELKTPLHQVFRKSLDTSIVPSQWRQSDIAPIHKKGPNNVMNNYRPINLTSQVCKVWESILGERMMKHLDDNLLLSPEQHGFVRGRSCQSNILSCMEDWTRAVDENDSVDVIYFDYEKAFDKVSHKLLLEKLKWYGIKGKVWEWIKQFLTGRVQRVKIGNAKSSWRAVLSSVCQGTVLGVKLFVIFINDLPKQVKSPILLSENSENSTNYWNTNDPRQTGQTTKVKLLADDTKAYQRIRVGKEQQDAMALQDTVNEIHSWAEKWQMKIHPDKTRVLHVGPENPRLRYLIDKVDIQTNDLHKDIGFLIPGSLSTANHIQKARARALMEIGIIRRTFDFLDRRAFILLYNQKIRPHLEWGTAALAPQSKAEAKALERVQDKATYLVKSLRRLSAEERRVNLGLFPLSYRRMRGDLIEVLKILRGWTRMDYHQFWEVRDSRNGPILVKDQIGPNREGHGRKQRMSFFSYRVIKPWNWLSKEIKLSPSINAFKNGLDALMRTDRWKILMQQID